MAMAASPRSLPTREMGYLNPYGATFYGTNVDADELTAALIWPNDLRVYDQMVRQEAQIVAVMRAVCLPVQRTQYRLDPQGARPEVVQLIAEDLGLPVKGLDVQGAPGRRRKKFSWTEHVRQALLQLRYGHMFFEQVYDVSSGQARLAKLAPRMPRTIHQINVAPDGGLMSIEQFAPVASNGMSVTIPVRRLVVYVNEMEGANWTGNSMLRSAYKHWLLKDQELRTQTQQIVRNGMGIPVYEGTESENGNDMVAGQAIATSIRAGDNSGTAIPAGAKLSLMGVTGALPNIMEPINYHDQQIARAMLAHFLNLGTQSSSATGSYSLGSEFADFFSMSLQTVADHICDVATQHVVEDIVDANWGTDEPAPAIVCDPIGSQHDLTGAAIQMLAQAGVLFRDKPTEQVIRQSYGLPPADYDDPIPPQTLVTGPPVDPNTPVGGN